MEKHEKLKYELVSINSMNRQINLRLPETMLRKARKHSEKHGYSSLQEFIKETLREKLFEDTTITKKELKLVKKLAEISEEKGLYGTEDDLYKNLK